MVWLWNGTGYRACAGLRGPGGDAGIPDEYDAVIVEAGASGRTEPAEGHGRGTLVLNAGAPAFADWSTEEIRRRLRRSGTAARETDGELGAARTYAVSLFQLRPIAVASHRPAAVVPQREAGRALPGAVPGIRDTSERPLSEQDARYRPLARLATRALYACGLDNGIVELADDGEGACFVTGIRLPAGGEYARGVWQDAAAGLARELAAAADAGAAGGSVPILLGADPEFLLLSAAGKVVSAARYLSDGHGAGCDAVVVGGEVRYPVAELRPAPSPTPEGLARNVRRLLRQAARRIPDRPPLRWAAGGMPAAGFSLGGHLHLSGVPLTGRLLRQLDSCVAFPLAMVESPAEQARRPRYGALGDFRLQPHGGFEYRTPPSWLVSPLAAKAAFALALLCARETAALSYVPAEEERYVAAYYAGDRRALAGCLERLAASMRATPSYAELGRWIEPLLGAIHSGRTWDAAADIRDKWRVASAPLASAP
ncbi:putative amidoligase domain-containing protein [Paenibacillus sp. GCM10023250]|uniref:putative amidoligase domain-containing protein n=1 Tax=Paenibacillus sp. GCM10023250 TaxID=3252648 RepID=UPI003612BBEA